MIQPEANALMHLYIGQPSVQSFGSIELGNTKIIDGVDIDTMRATEHSLKIVPILTPLADISEVDAEYIVNLRRDSERHITLEQLRSWGRCGNRPFNTVLEDSVDVVVSEMDYMMGDPMAWSYLLSKGYDVHMLIPAGFAHDKKTFKK